MVLILTFHLHLFAYNVEYQFAPVHVKTFKVSNGKLTIQTEKSGQIEVNGKGIKGKKISFAIDKYCIWKYSTFNRGNGNSTSDFSTYKEVRANILQERKAYVKYRTIYNVGMSTITVIDGKAVLVNYFRMAY